MRLTHTASAVRLRAAPRHAAFYDETSLSCHTTLGFAVYVLQSPEMQQLVASMGPVHPLVGNFSYKTNGQK